MLSGEAACSDAWGKVATGLEKSSALVSKAMDIGLFGVESSNSQLEVFNIAYGKRSWTSAVMLMWLSVSGRRSMARWEVEDGVEVLWGARALRIWSSNVTWQSSTSRNEGSWAELPSTSPHWRSSPDSKVCTSYKSPFSPSGYTNWSPYCKSLHTSCWWRHLHAFLLGIPLITVLRWPSLGRGTCWASLFSCTKA